VTPTALDANLDADDVGCSAKAALPKFVANHGYLRVGRTGGVAIIGSEQASEQRSCAELGVGLARDSDHAVLLKNAANFDIVAAAISPSE
jgi:hypothetical protein